MQVEFSLPPGMTEEQFRLLVKRVTNPQPQKGEIVHCTDCFAWSKDHCGLYSSACKTQVLNQYMQEFNNGSGLFSRPYRFMNKKEVKK